MIDLVQNRSLFEISFSLFVLWLYLALIIWLFGGFSTTFKVESQVQEKQEFQLDSSNSQSIKSSFKSNSIININENQKHSSINLSTSTSKIASTSSPFSPKNGMSLREPSEPSASSSSSGKVVDILLHNLSYSDMVFGLEDDVNTLGRPKENVHGTISKLLLNNINETTDIEYVKLLDKHVHSTSILSSNIDVENEKVACGYNLKESSVSSNHENIIFQKRIDINCDDSTIKEDNASKVHKIVKLYFPLISCLLPRWVEDRDVMNQETREKILILVSGVRSSLDNKVVMNDSSTKPSAFIIKTFINRVYPDIKVEIIHSNSDWSRYDENIFFVRIHILERLNFQRNKLAFETEDWKDHLRITMSIADGSTARLGAIRAVLRNFRPWYLHFSNLVTFWEKHILVKDDIEKHSFADMETIPAVPIKDINDSILRTPNSDSSFCNITTIDGSNHGNGSSSDPGDLLVEEMRNFRDYFYELRDNPSSHDLSLFWMRKTKKPVLSVLCVRIHGPDGSESFELIRGTNMEVSMPTGSLCAERNAIGTALGKDIALKRQDIVGVAVLGVSLEANRCFSVSPVSSPKRSNSLKNLLELNHDSETEIEEAYYQENDSYMRNVTMLRLPSGLPSIDKEVYNNNSGNTNDSNRNNTPLKKADDDHRGAPQSQYLNRHNYAIKRTIATVSSKDRNPLRPCGACTEWLKKIASVNPSFFVLTFTNEELSGIFREEIDSFD